MRLNLKCSYQTRVIHKYEYVDVYLTSAVEDTTTFGECIKTECPYYNELESVCRKVESEVKK